MKFKMFFCNNIETMLVITKQKGGVGFDRSGSSIRFKVIFT